MSEAGRDDESATKTVRRADLGAFGEEVPTLLVLAGTGIGEIYSLSEAATILGRGAECDIVIPDDGMSRQHCRFTLTEGGVQLEDLGSTNGTWVEQVRIHGPVVLSHGARLRLGANAVLRFELQTEEEHAYHRDMYDAAVRDPLTGGYNKRYFNERAQAEFGYARRHGVPLSLLVIDVDHFKDVNDRYGHAVGDRILARVGAVLLAQVRAEDVVARFGGDEFVVLVRGAHAAGALRLAERMRSGVAEIVLAVDGSSVSVSVSVGVASAQSGMHSADELFGVADRALYEAKRRGRDQVATVSR